jgi:hypothetical protein
MGCSRCPLITYAYLKRTPRGFKSSVKPFPGAAKCYARWKNPTYGIWKNRIERKGDAIQTETLIWYYFLLETNIVPVTHVRDHLDQPSHQAILKFIPSSLPSLLVTQFLKEIYLTQADSLRIERECSTLWSSTGATVKNPHPLLDEVVTAMGLYEKLGIQVWPSLDDLPVKTYTAIRQVLANYSQLMSLNEQQRRLRQQAINEAPPNFRHP